MPTPLKYLFFRQVERFEKMIELEQKLGMLMPAGYKEVNSLRAIADSILKLEIGERWMKGKGGAMPYGGRDPGRPQPHREPSEPLPIESSLMS